MTGTWTSQVIWLTALTLGQAIAPEDGAGRPSPVRLANPNLERPGMEPKKSARADIIQTYSNNVSDLSYRMKTNLPQGEFIFVPGDIELDGKVFQTGIKNSRWITGEPGPDQVDIEIPAHSSRLLVGHYRFEMKEMPEGGERADPPARQWVGTMVGFSILYEWPDKIDEKNSGAAIKILPTDPEFKRFVNILR